MAETYKTLDRGPVEERVKLVIQMMCGSWDLMSETETGHWLVNADSRIPSVGVPDDILNYMKAQDLFTINKPWRLS